MSEEPELDEESAQGLARGAVISFYPCFPRKSAAKFFFGESRAYPQKRNIETLFGGGEEEGGRFHEGDEFFICADFVEILFT
jgi:hypothetical protein